MMINKRLIGTVKESKKYIAANILFQWISLAWNILMMVAIAKMLESLLAAETVNGGQMARTAGIAIGALVARYLCTLFAGRMSYLSSKSVKKKLRTLIFQKLLRLGVSYRSQTNTSEMVQIAVEGVDQLETYFGAYLPQLFYAMLAPLTLFFVLSVVNLPSAVVLLLCVPLIPLCIALIQRWAKRLLGRYWSQYTSLGNTFLENLQGLTTTKIYQSDGFKHQEMNEESERFRKITMKVLSMQLNSITIMDFIAYGGAALGVGMAAMQLQAGAVDPFGALLIILLSADFFLPMRALGSYFHIAMNGMAASEKIFHLLDLPEPAETTAQLIDTDPIIGQNLSFSYDADRDILRDIHFSFSKGHLSAIVGASGSGKSTVAGILMGHNKNYTGTLTIGGTPLSAIAESSLMQQCTYINHQSYLFKGTVRENLLMGREDADDDALWTALEQVQLADFLRRGEGLSTVLSENGANLSGGQRQRLALARALLHDSEIYIFDEATSNIDIESENAMMEEIHRLAKTKTVILISHRLFNVKNADCIYVLDGGRLVEEGTHDALLAQKGIYEHLWATQQELEHYLEGGRAQ